ncbi:MAG TPA: hypothetical protein DCY94_05225, partial [Firmicutes bacterium]|nr:hypothetical protein [Bacillota bacterium]
MQYVPISFKSDYSLLKSTLKIKDIIHYASSCGSNYVGLLDDNPYGMMDFYDKCNKAGLKCVFGMVVKIGDNKIYLYVKNYEGYLNLIKINDYIQEKNLSLDVLFKHNNGLIVVLPYENYNFFNRLRVAFQVYLGYKNKTELKNAIQITKSIVFMNEVMCFRKEDVNLLRVLYKIGNQSYDGSDNYILDGDEEDAASIDAFVSEIDFTFRLEEKHIPTFCKNPIESWRMLYTLAFKGLEKRLGTKEIPNRYRDRLVHELKVIKDMGFVDYFLIVYDYVKF